LLQLVICNFFGVAATENVFIGEQNNANDNWIKVFQQLF